MALSGVRSSWLITARNCPFAAFAASAVPRRRAQLVGLLEQLLVGELQLERLLLQRELRRAPLGEVARDLAEADEPAVVVPKRGQDRAGPEAPAVVSEAPALVLGAPVAGRALEQRRGAPRGAVLRGEERLVRPPDDLVGPVALDALRPGVPRGDAPVDVEAEDGVVRDAHDEAAELRLARGEPLDARQDLAQRAPEQVTHPRDRRAGGDEQPEPEEVGRALDPEREVRRDEEVGEGRRREGRREQPRAQPAVPGREGDGDDVRRDRVRLERGPDGRRAERGEHHERRRHGVPGPWTRPQPGGGGRRAARPGVGRRGIEWPGGRVGLLVHEPVNRKRCRPTTLRQHGPRSRPRTTACRPTCPAAVPK
jgi:hypothetical protein